MTVISTRQLKKRYGRRIGVDGVDLDVPAGSIFGFLGPNGAGKTTTIRVLLGLLRPSGGRATVLGLDCWRQSARIKRDVGYVPGDLRLYPWMTGLSALRIVGRVRGLDLVTAARDLVNRFRLEMDVPVRRMSRGMRQKLGLLIALAHAPKLLILDEPTSGLDPLMQNVLADHLREMAGRGHTIFFSSHTLSEVEELCDRVAIVRDGRIVADESLDDLRRGARRRVVIRFADAETARRLDAPAGFDVLRRHGADWTGEMDGEASALIAWLSGRPVRDVTIGPPDLETLFQRFYRNPGDDEGTAP